MVVNVAYVTPPYETVSVLALLLSWFCQARPNEMLSTDAPEATVRDWVSVDVAPGDVVQS